MALAAMARKSKDGAESETERARNGVRVVQCLVSVLRIVSAVRAETEESDATTLSQQVHGVVVPPLVALVVREQNGEDGQSEAAELAVAYLSEHLTLRDNESNVSAPPALTAVLQSLPRSTVSALEGAMQAYVAEHGTKHRKKKKKRKREKERVVG